MSVGQSRLPGHDTHQRHPWFDHHVRQRVRSGALRILLPALLPGLGQRRLHKDAYDWLRGQAWPGNVRQLKNVLEGAAVLADDVELTAADLEGAGTPGAAGRSADGETDWFGYARLEDFRAATEKEFLRRKLLEFGGNIKRTAENIQLQRSNLYKKLDRYGLK